MRRFIVAGNWKMHKTAQEAHSFCQNLKGLKKNGANEYVIFPSFTLLSTLLQFRKDLPFEVGAQNCHFEKQGAFTGEISCEQLKDLGCTHVLVGHSERRSLFGESDSFLAKKVAAAQRAEISPMLCVGETLEEREKGQTDKVICQQLETGLSLADLNQNFTVAYEPVWAIGTGKVATPEMAQQAHKTLRHKLAQMTSTDRASQICILYGGSVKPDNAHSLAAQSEIDGFLVGGASLDASSFLRLAEVTRAT